MGPGFGREALEQRAAAEVGVGNICNSPLKPGDGGDEFRHAYETRILPALDDVAPDFLLVSAGFDAHINDPLAQIRLLEGDFAWVTEKLLEAAQKHTGGKLVSTLEGGYALGALGRDPNEAVAWLKTLSPSFADAGELRRLASDAHARGLSRSFRGHTAHISDITVPEDRDALRRFFHELSPESHRRRFFTLGDPSGIGPELALKAFVARCERGIAPFFVLGDPTQGAKILAWIAPVRKFPDGTTTRPPPAWLQAAIAFRKASVQSFLPSGEAP